MYDSEDMSIASILSLILGLQILVTHLLATELGLYFTVWWLDIVVHILGGMWLVFAWRSLIDTRLIAARYWSIGLILGGTFVVMIGWELFGVFVEQGLKDGFWFDTVSDTVYGIVGVVCGFWIVQRLQALN